MWVDPRRGSLRALPLWQSESLEWGASSRFPSAGRLASPGPELTFAGSQSPGVCTPSLPQDGF